MQATLVGDEEHKRLILVNPEAFKRSLQAFDVAEVEVEVRVRPQFRTKGQLGYYWGVVVPACQMGFSSLGYDFDRQETHRQLSDRFLFEEHQDEITGQPIRHHLSLKHDAQEVDTRTMGQYLERVKQFAAEHLGGLYIPEPGEDVHVSHND